PQMKAIVGPQLVKMFTDEEMFKIRWTESLLWMRHSWIYEDDRVDVVLKWLQDSSVTKKLPEKDRAWVKSLSSKSQPDADLLEHIARYMAHKWLQAGDWDFMELFYWLNAYLNKIANRKDPNVERETKDPGAKKITASRIHEVADWGRQCLGLNNLGYEETRNVAKTLREFGKLDDAIETFKRASSLQEDNWSARIGLARAYDYQGQYVLALETLEALKASIDSGESKPSDPKYYLHPITQHLAELHEKIGNAEKAWDIYESILQEHPDDYETAHAMALLLHGRRNYTQLVEFLEGLKRSKDEVTGLDRRTQMFHVYFWVDNFHGAIAAAGKSFN
ncbi:hypothetical protein F66182_16447, partial [Fusarium sp. NRRL 66182]